MGKEITFPEAMGLIAELAGRSDKDSLYQRLETKDPIICVSTLPELLTTETALPMRAQQYAKAFAPVSAHIRQHLVKSLLSCGEFELAQELEVLANNGGKGNSLECEYIAAHNIGNCSGHKFDHLANHTSQPRLVT